MMVLAAVMTVATILVCSAQGLPIRDPDDDTLSVSVVSGQLWISVVGPKPKQETKEMIRISEFNAWALVGILSLFLGLKLPKSVAKQIRL